MINLTEAIKGNETEARKIHLLTSRALIREILQTNQNVRCCGVLTPFLKKLGDLGPTTIGSQPDVIGWLNLYVELSSQGTCEACAKKVSGDQHVLPLLNLVLMRSSLDGFRKGILGPVSEGPDQWPVWKKRMGEWEELLTRKVGDKSQRFNQTHIGQLLIMHLVEVVLEFYRSDQTVRGRGILNLLLVPLLRSIFQNPDRAHVAYHCYHGDGPKTNDVAAFDMLYRDEIGVIEEFRSRSVKHRGRILELVRAAAKNATGRKSGLPLALEKEINRIIHGRDDKDLTLSPHPKMTRLSQLTCLIRELESADSAKYRKYGPHLEGVIYRQAELIDDARPSFLKWHTLESSTKQDFIGAVSNRYKQGHSVAFLSKIFVPETGKETGKETVSAWIQDGEVSFLWLCAAIIKANSDFEAWADGKLTSTPSRITAEEIGGTGFTQTVSLDIRASCKDFLKEELRLIDGNNRATAKCWALGNFLQRTAVSERPGHYQNDPWKDLLATIYAQLSDSDLNERSLICVARLIKEKLPYTSIADLADNARLPTFLLECLLRRTRPEPYSLFFYPINFDEVKNGQIVPGVFLGGTFAGLEWDCFPSVTERQDYHLTALIDAIRPIIDYEIGRVLSDDQDHFAEGKLAREREKNLRAIQPAVNKLTEIFRHAQALAFRIESAVDPAWSGLFTTQMHQICARLFSSQEALEIEGSRDGEPREVHLAHEITTIPGHLHAVLIYLARDVGQYSDPTPVKTLSDWNVAAKIMKKDLSGDDIEALFHDLPFMRAFCEAASEINSDGKHAATHLALLKILAVDCIDATRSLHVVQLAAALGLARAGSVCGGLLPGGDASGKVKFGTDKSKPVEGDFWPLHKDGIQKLAELIERDPMFESKPIANPFSTGELQAVAELAEGMEPHRFLRALRILSEEVLAPEKSEAKRVTIDSWSVTFLPEVSEEMGSRIIVVMKCNGCFENSAKMGIWNYVQTNDESYHNLRSNLKLIAQGVGAFPSFQPASDLTVGAQGTTPSGTRTESPWPEPPPAATDDEHRFLIIENRREKKCTIQLRIGMQKKAGNQPIPAP